MQVRQISVFGFFIFLALQLIGCKDEGPQISIVGLNGDGEEVHLQISEKGFNDRFSDVLNKTSSNSIQTLNENSAVNARWSLEEVEVGLDLQATGKIISIVHLAATSGASMTLTKKSKISGANHE